MELQHTVSEGSSSSTCQQQKIGLLFQHSRSGRFQKVKEALLNKTSKERYRKYFLFFCSFFLAYLCSQGRARNGVVGLAWQIGQTESSSAEVEDLSLENGRRKFFTDDEFRRGRSNNNISCHQHKNTNLASFITNIYIVTLCNQNSRDREEYYRF